MDFFILLGEILKGSIICLASMAFPPLGLLLLYLLYDWRE